MENKQSSDVSEDRKSADSNREHAENISVEHRYHVLDAILLNNEHAEDKDEPHGHKPETFGKQINT